MDFATFRNLKGTFAAFRGSTLPLIGVALISAVTCSTLIINSSKADPANTAESKYWLTDGIVYSVAPTSSATYIGGDFSYVGPDTGSTGNVINGASADSSFPAVTGGEIYAAVSDGSGGWYIGGNFTKVGSVTRASLAHILSDKTVDSAWDPVVSGGTVKALAKSGSNVYIGGTFTAVDGQAHNRLAVVNTSGVLDSNWTASVTGGTTSVNAIVFTGSGSSARVKIGGNFTAVNGQTRQKLAALTTSGTLDSSWTPATNSTVATMVVGSTDTVYIGGSFTTVTPAGGSSTTRNRLAQIYADGRLTSWAPSADSSVNALTLSNGNIYIGGSFTTVTPVGGSAATRNKLASVVADTNGTLRSWPCGQCYPNGDVKALSNAGGNVYVGGSFTRTGSGSNLVKQVRLTSYSETSTTASGGTPSVNGLVNTIAATSSGTYVGGKFSSIGGVARDNIAALSNTNGQALSFAPTLNGAVKALDVAEPVVYAGGEFTDFGDSDGDYVAGIDQSTGDKTTYFRTDSGVEAVKIDGATLYVGGSFENAIYPEGSRDLSVPRSGIAAFDMETQRATSWDPSAIATDDSGNPIAGWVLDIEPLGSSVYVGGWFGEIGGQTRVHIAELSKSSGQATEWDPGFVDSFSGISDLALTSSSVYVGGTFSEIGGQSRRNLAELRRDQNTNVVTSWNPSLNGTIVEAVAVSDSTVYIGGDFSSAGGQARSGFAGVDRSTATATDWTPAFVGGARAIVLTSNSIVAGGGLYTDDQDEPRSPSQKGVAVFAGNPTLVPQATNQPTVTGTAQVGQTLSCSNATWKNNPSQYSYEWLRNSSSVVGSGATYLLTSSDDKTDISCRVTATNSAGSGTPAVSESKYVTRPVPVNTALPSITGNPYAGETLTCSNGSWTNEPTGFKYQWLNNGSAITGKTAATYTVQGSDLNDQISCRVTATNSGGDSTAATSQTTTIVTAPTVPVWYAAPYITWPNAYENDDYRPDVGETLTCNEGYWSSDTPITYSYQWKRNGQAISGTPSTPVEGNNTYVVSSGDIDQEITCTVVATNEAGSSQPVTSQDIVPEAAPTVPVWYAAPYITWPNAYEDGDYWPDPGETLTCNEGYWSSDTSITYSYQWKRNGQAISGTPSAPTEGNNTYVVISDDISQEITCTVVAANEVGSSQPVTSQDVVPEDGDGKYDPDNCPDVYNPDQADSDGDGIGDACDPLIPVLEPLPVTSSPTPTAAATSPTTVAVTGKDTTAPKVAAKLLGSTESKGLLRKISKGRSKLKLKVRISVSEPAAVSLKVLVTKVKKCPKGKKAKKCRQKAKKALAKIKGKTAASKKITFNQAGKKTVVLKVSRGKVKLLRKVLKSAGKKQQQFVVRCQAVDGAKNKGSSVWAKIIK